MINTVDIEYMVSIEGFINEINRNQPSYDVNRSINKIIEYAKEHKLSREEIVQMNKCLGSEFLNNTLQGHSIRKPHGYAGDFEMIDKIYTKYSSPIEHLKNWDEYFHNQAAPKAVRNRKEYFKSKILQSLDKSSVHLLNLASGPGRDMKELYDNMPSDKKVYTTCVELDAQAITYAKKLTESYSDRISFIHKNVIRYSPDRKFDIIWSAGLFDYFDDKTFLFMLKRMKSWLNEGGKVIIGNFNQDHNPSRDYMGILGEWYLNHRTEDQLRGLAVKAGFPNHSISIESEEENVNLFLNIN